MTIRIFEQAIAQHIGQFLAGQEAVHVLCPAVYHCRYAALIIRKRFPFLEIGGPVDELPWLTANRSEDLVRSIRPVMVGSMYGLCLLYLRASLAIPDKAARFKQAIALVINYDADEMGKSLCCLGEDIAEPVISLHVEDFLSVYSTVRHVSVEFPPCRPEWDFGQSKPVY